MKQFPSDPSIASPALTTTPTTQAGAPVVVDLDRLIDQSRRDARMQKVLLGAALVAILAFVALVYLPSVRRLQMMHRKISDDAALLDAESRQANRLPGVRSAADRLEHHLGHFKPLPSQLEQSQFFRDVYTLTERLSLRELQLQPLGVADVGATGAAMAVREFQVKLHFRGDFVNVYNFLRQLEELPRLLRVREVVVLPPRSGSLVETASTGGEMQGEVQVEMIVSLFFGSTSSASFVGTPMASPFASAD